jgi:5-methyltetrahydropteroyltriglutamate--homocysteine methyltransferase
VISIEASRSKGELVEAFKNLPEWDRGIGIGVYDIHSPAIPSEKEIEEVLKKVLSILPEDLIWVNPDCGLKTRRWDEVIPSLKNMVNATKKVRKEYASK